MRNWSSPTTASPPKPSETMDDTPSPLFGRDLQRRFSLPRLGRFSRRGSIGHMARSSVRFGGSVGRSLSIRRLVSEGSTRTGPMAEGWSVGCSPPRNCSWPGFEARSGRRRRKGWRWRRIRESLRRRWAAGVRGGGRPGECSIALPPRGLTSVSSHGDVSPAGPHTGPGGAKDRMVRTTVPVRQLPEVSAAGSMGSARSPSRPEQSPAPPAAGPAPRLARQPGAPGRPVRGQTQMTASRPRQRPPPHTGAGHCAPSTRLAAHPRPMGERPGRRPLAPSWAIGAHRTSHPVEPHSEMDPSACDAPQPSPGPGAGRHRGR